LFYTSSFKYTSFNISLNYKMGAMCSKPKGGPESLARVDLKLKKGEKANINPDASTSPRKSVSFANPIEQVKEIPNIDSKMSNDHSTSVPTLST